MREKSPRVSPGSAGLRGDLELLVAVGDSTRDGMPMVVYAGMVEAQGCQSTVSAKPWILKPGGSKVFRKSHGQSLEVGNHRRPNYMK